MFVDCMTAVYQRQAWRGQTKDKSHSTSPSRHNFLCVFQWVVVTNFSLKWHESWADCIISLLRECLAHANTTAQRSTNVCHRLHSKSQNRAYLAILSWLNCCFITLMLPMYCWFDCVVSHKTSEPPACLPCALARFPVAAWNQKEHSVKMKRYRLPDLVLRSLISFLPKNRSYFYY